MDEPLYCAPQPCPYLPGRTAMLPFYVPRRKFTATEFDEVLAQGRRRSGTSIYFADCRACRACEAIRLDISHFQPHRTQQRVWRRGQKDLRVVWGPPQVDRQRVALYNRHRHGRGLADMGDDLDAQGYEMFLAETCCETIEAAYYRQEELAMVAILDLGRAAASAVYTFFDPALARLSPGVFSILNQVEFCRRTQRRYLYLGYYVGGSAHMAYKATYLPHQRLINHAWRTFAS